MEMRVEQLSVRSDVPVDTIRYYQSKGLLAPPRRQGRVAWYGEDHVERLARIRSLQQRGFTLATIVRLVAGELDAADEALLGALSGGAETTGGRESGPTERPSHRSPEPGDHGYPDPEAGPSPTDDTLTIAELAAETGVPLALLKAVEAEGLLIPRRIGGCDRYTSEDVAACRAGLLLLEWGIPLSALLELSRRHDESTRAVAREAVTMFSTYVRGPIHQRQMFDDDRTVLGAADDSSVDRLLQAYAELLPAVNTLVGHHFTRTLVNAALEHVEQDGWDAERRAIAHQVGTEPNTDRPPGDRESAARR
jgi:DNA-binding transcriptional MerR regulator